MTQAEAYIVLGVSRSASRSRKEQAYQEKQRKLRLKLVPGNPLADRRKAQAELARLTTAWQVLKASPTARPRAKKPAPRKWTPPKPQPVPPQIPQTLTEAWELLLDLMPFPKPVTVMLVIIVFLLTIVSLIRSF